jgi:hypothetical protein
MPDLEETVGATDTVACDCEPCKRKHGLPHSVHAGTIHAYSSTPRNGWTARRVGEADRTDPTFGVELETDAPEYVARRLSGEPSVPYLSYNATQSDRDDRDAAEALWLVWDRRNRAHLARQRAAWTATGSMTADEAVSVAAPRGFWHPKHDGSVSGPEFASQPATLAYWRAQRGHIAGMYKALLHGGMRSHDGDHCGLHVNIGSDAFGDADHLGRFIALVAVNPRWATRMAMRTHESMAAWANFSSIGDPARRARLVEDWRRYGEASTPHSSAVNLAHAGRVEFRLPRGTLRLDRFYAKLEWAAAMVEYTRDAARAISPSPFMKWAIASGEYPELARYMAERFPARIDAMGADALSAPAAPARTLCGTLTHNDAAGSRRLYAEPCIRPDGHNGACERAM